MIQSYSGNFVAMQEYTYTKCNSLAVASSVDVNSTRDTSVAQGIRQQHKRYVSSTRDAQKWASAETETYITSLKCVQYWTIHYIRGQNFKPLNSLGLTRKPYGETQHLAFGVFLWRQASQKTVLHVARIVVVSKSSVKISWKGLAYNNERRLHSKTPYQANLYSLT